MKIFKIVKMIVYIASLVVFMACGASLPKNDCSDSNVENMDGACSNNLSTESTESKEISSQKNGMNDVLNHTLQKSESLKNYQDIFGTQTMSVNEKQKAFASTIATSGERTIVGSCEKEKQSVFVYTRLNEDSFGQPVEIKSIDEAKYFGCSVAIGYITAAISAKEVVSENGEIIGGKVYIYEFSDSVTSGSWDSSVVLESDEASEIFGYTVAISGRYLIVGSPSIDINKPGKVYIYEHIAANEWKLKDTLFSETRINTFGTSVAISSSYVVVGAPMNQELKRGEISIYRMNENGTYDLQKQIFELDDFIAGYIGHSVAISSYDSKDYLVYGVLGDSASQDVSGKVIVLSLQSETIQYVIEAPYDASIEINKQFGARVAVSYSNIVVTSSAEGGQVFEYNFDQVSNAWMLKGIFASKRVSSSTQFFGSSISAADDMVVIGSPDSDSFYGYKL